MWKNNISNSSGHGLCESQRTTDLWGQEFRCRYKIAHLHATFLVSAPNLTVSHTSSLTCHHDCDYRQVGPGVYWELWCLPEGYRSVPLYILMLSGHNEPNSMCVNGCCMYHDKLHKVNLIFWGILILSHNFDRYIFKQSEPIFIMFSAKSNQGKWSHAFKEWVVSYV